MGNRVALSCALLVALLAVAACDTGGRTGDRCSATSQCAPELECLKFRCSPALSGSGGLLFSPRQDSGPPDAGADSGRRDMGPPPPADMGPPPPPPPEDMGPPPPEDTGPPPPADTGPPPPADMGAADAGPDMS